MPNAWNLPTTASAANPLSFSAGEPPPPSLPPDPHDLNPPLSPHDYPTLSFAAKTGSSSFSKRRGTMKPKSPQTGAAVQHQLTVSSSAGSPPVPENTKTVPLESSSTVHRSEIQNFTVEKPLLPNIESHQNFIILPQKSSSPSQTNKASSLENPVQAENQTNHISSNTSAETQLPSPLTPPFVPQTSPLVSIPSLIQRLRQAEDKTLRRRPTPVIITENGRPRILIPDSVFEKGAAIHKDFIICYYNGKAPPFNQIQSVFNHMWGKGKKLEIHNNPLNRSTIVRIPNAYLREKILEKNIWYVGDSMFHTAQWSSEHSKATPPLKAIKIWAHLTGVPLDLRHEEGLSLVAGLIGDPKETDDFTKNLVSLTLSHVKVEVDLTVPLPSVVEFVRQSGEVVEVSVHYPWIPPTCSHCHELGHIVKNCLQYIPPPPAPAPSQKPTDKPQKPQKPQKPSEKSQKQPQPAKPQTPIYRKKTKDPLDLLPSSSNTDLPPIPTLPQFTPPPTTVVSTAPIGPDVMFTDSPQPLCQLPMTVFSTVQSSLSSPDLPRPSLKRSRSSPTFTPGHSSNPNPFCSSSNPPIQNLFNTSDPPLNPDPSLPSIKNSTSADDTSFVSKGSSQLNGNPFYLLS